MTARPLRPKLILPLVLLTLTAAILSCAPVQTGPRAWIDWPRDGYEIAPGTTLSLICHAYAEQGVAEVHLAVNGQPYRITQPAQPGEQFVEIHLEWESPQAGDYLLSVTSFETTGEASNPAHVTITVIGEEPSLILTPHLVTTVLTMTLESPTVTPATGTPTATGTATATPVTPTPTGTSTRTGTPTSTPTRTQTPTRPPAPTIVSFTANPPSIEAGDCSTLSWAVEGSIGAVYLDGEGVGDHDSRDRCPDSTTTYTLRAVGPGGERTDELTVSVTQPPADTEGPPAPSLVSPIGGVELPCDDVTLDWNPVSDPSGISMYYVKVEKVTGSSKSGAWTTTNTQYTVPATWIVCGFQYRWAVRAEDGLGNFGSWSDWSDFSVTLT